MLPLVVHTANILGVFGDPFEFEGDYGAEVNSTRQKVFELVVSKHALAGELSDDQIKALMKDNTSNPQQISEFRASLLEDALRQDQQNGPILSDLITPDLFDALELKQHELQDAGFT